MGLYPLWEENARRTDARHHPLTNFDQYHGQVEDLVLLIITFLISFWDRECRITLTMRWHTAACHKLSTLPPVPPRVPPWLCPMRGLGEYSFRKFFFCYLTTGKILLKTLSKTFRKTQFDRRNYFYLCFWMKLGRISTLQPWRLNMVPVSMDLARHLALYGNIVRRSRDETQGPLIRYVLCISCINKKILHNHTMSQIEAIALLYNLALWPNEDKNIIYIWAGHLRRMSTPVMTDFPGLMIKEQDSNLNI